MGFKTTVSILTLATLSTVWTAAAQSSYSVWDEMRDTDQHKVEGYLSDVVTKGDNIEVKYKHRLGNFDVESTIQFCESPALTQGSMTVLSEDIKTLLVNQRAEKLKELQRSGESVKLLFQGPWSPCLKSVSSTKIDR